MIRPLRIEDAESIFEYARDSELPRYEPWKSHQNLQDAKQFTRDAIARNDKFPFDTLGVCLLNQPDRVIGTFGIKPCDSEHQGELAYALARKHWRQGIGFEVCSALMNKAFNDCGFKRIFAKCARENITSKSLMKKLGMRYEGCLRAVRHAKGRFWDMEYYAILDDEWRVQKDRQAEQAGQEYEIVYEPSPKSEDVDALGQGVVENARLKKGMKAIESFGFFVKTAQGKVLAGCQGAIYYGCLYTDLLWVSDTLRGQGIGTRLLKAAEQLGKDKGCRMATINTMDWEALELYQKLEYKVDLKREGYDKDSVAYFLSKRL